MQTEMTPSARLLSDITAFDKYAKFMPQLRRRESLAETINRDMHMHLDRFPKLSGEIVKAFSLVHELKVMPSMRGLQFAGDAILKNNCRQYNCSFLNVDSERAFGEALFLLLSGCGVGYSVQSRHVSQLPKVRQPRQEGLFMVQDSIQGWGQALDVLMEAYLLCRVRPFFDFSGISLKGTYLPTTGAKAPGPDPLRRMLEQVEARLKLAVGRQLTDLEVHDIMCIMSECVMSGGIRRAAMIALFDRWSKAMLACKHGSWWEHSPWRAMANNSAVLPRKETTFEEFMAVFQACRDSNAGEPAWWWTNDPDCGTNPCVEIGLHSKQFCNLTITNMASVRTKKEFLRRVRAAALIGTLQASYTDFPYIRPAWQETTEREALLGVSMTGIADSDSFLEPDLLEEGARMVLDTNEHFARKLGINPAARATAIKPEGTSSCVLGTSSGVHDWHDGHFVRRERINKGEALDLYLRSVVPDLVEDDVMSAGRAVVSVPIKAPDGALVRPASTALSLFQRAMKYNRHWVAPGYRSGPNNHNVSVTINVKPDEWDGLGEALWKDRKSYAGVSLLPYDGGTYRQAPFESISQERYEEMSKLVKEIDLKQVFEDADYTSRMAEPACAGGLCSMPGQ